MPTDRELFESQVPTEDRESTTFCQDLLIAERFGTATILDTYKRAFRDWRCHYKYLTELTMVLNHLLAKHFCRDGEDDERTKLYNRLWQDTYDWGRENLKGDELSYFYAVLD